MSQIEPDDEFSAALEAFSKDPCAYCGQPLGTAWTTALNAAGDRQVRVHITVCRDLIGEESDHAE